MNKVQEMLSELLKVDSAEMLPVNRNLMKIAVKQGKKHGYITMAVDDETAKGFMLGGGKKVGFMLIVSREDFEDVVKGTELENDDSTESPSDSGSRKESGGSYE